MGIVGNTWIAIEHPSKSQAFFYQYMQEMCCRFLDLKFNAKLKLESGNQKIQYGHQAAILKVKYLKINRLLSIHTSNVLLKFGLDIQSQTEVKSPETEKSKMSARRPLWKWHRWKSIGFCPWPSTICIWNFKLKFQSKLELRSGNHVAYRRTDRQTDGQGDSSIPPPPPKLGGGIIIHCWQFLSTYKDTSGPQCVK